jgi:hypothetical protein
MRYFPLIRSLVVSIFCLAPLFATTVPNIFSNGQVADANLINQNFDVMVQAINSTNVQPNLTVTGASNLSGLLYPMTDGNLGNALATSGNGHLIWATLPALPSSANIGDSLTWKGTSWEASPKNFAIGHTTLALAPSSNVTVGHLRFRYSSNATGGFIEVLSVTPNEHMQVYCSKKSYGISAGGSTTLENYRGDSSYNSSTWSPFVSLWNGSTYDDRVALSTYDTFDGTLFTMGNGGAPPAPNYYKLFASIDGYNNVLIQVEYRE